MRSKRNLWEKVYTNITLACSTLIPKTYLGRAVGVTIKQVIWLYGRT